MNAIATHLRPGTVRFGVVFSLLGVRDRFGVIAVAVAAAVAAAVALDAEP